ncbi:hypothetical protein P153DRAFT_432501 [Dothidotthia symphoricarpi CBS 119687]|uniref:Uncharacterized protein n=1 Tax=Dothidotthia symphoricarpi CBS 119687 TaxID=1392245 RepID=A0A6A6A8F6_9PLEO|nr:uncharacterized protein P153DRAFT_432501 [Dothidotthia symphoricarpi CBS 119687]KAF2128120.1 hypothetical protein P153DRAFT_432501 [Dothidotthia symphoricarpi CBS 119687]
MTMTRRGLPARAFFMTMWEVPLDVTPAMRYDNWDVILFPRDSPIPIQEFKTACYVSPDELGRQLPTLTCYIGALPPSTPFRISIHSWAPQAKPSPIIEARRKNNQKVVYTVQVIVDGARLFHDFYEIASKWPQDIAHEKRSITAVEQITSQRKASLEFPPFHQKILMQNSWDARDANGRIKVILSEQLISKTPHSPGELDFGASNEIVCFSFQHAPKEVLEQAGISWPIHNPLFLLPTSDRVDISSQALPSLPRVTKTRTTAPESRMQSPLSHQPRSKFPRSRNNEPLQRPNTQPPPFSQFPKPPTGARGSGHAGIWDDSFGSFGDSADDISMDTWSTRRSNSMTGGDMAMSDYMFAPMYPPEYGPPWGRHMQYDQSVNPGWDDHLSRKQRKDRDVVVTLRDDQLGQIIEAISPSKTNREGPPHDFGDQRHNHDAHPPPAHTYYPPKMGNVPLGSRPSSAALARTLSRAEFNNSLRNVSSKLSPDKTTSGEPHKNKPPSMYHPSFSSNKENRPPSQSRLPTPFAVANRVPTPNPFVCGMPTWDSDIEMRDPSSVFSSLTRFERSGALPPSHLDKLGPAHAPSVSGNVKSRKEGQGYDSPNLPDQGIRHDQSLLPAISIDPGLTQKKTGKGVHNTPGLNSSKYVEIIDVDAIDPNLSTNDGPHDPSKLSPFKPSHKSGMSSIDSTGRLERQLFSALGEELAAFDDDIDTPGMGPELAQAMAGSTAHSELSGSTMLNPAAGEFEPVKRKRQGTFGAERDRSPLTKKEKARQMGLEELEEQRVVPRLRGD